MSHMMPGEGPRPSIAEWQHLQRQQQLAAQPPGGVVGQGTGTPPTCTCGVFASGVCTQCHRPKCATHAGLVDDRWMCHQCSSPESQAKRAEQQRLARERALQEQQNKANKAREEAARAEHITSLPRLLGEPLAQWLAFRTEEGVQGRLTDVSGLELAEALALSRIPVRPHVPALRPWQANFWRSISDRPHPGGWRIERPAEPLTNTDYTGWFLQRDGSALYVLERYKKRGGGMTYYSVDETRSPDHLYNADTLLALRRRLTKIT